MDPIEGEIKSTGEGRFEWKIPNYFAEVSKKYEEDEWFDSPYFIYEEKTWNLALFPLSISCLGCFSLYLGSLDRRSFSSEYRLGLKKVDGNMEMIGSGIMQGDKCSSYTGGFKISELERRQSELVPSDILTVICILNREGNPGDHIPILTTPPTALEQSNMTSLEKLSDNFKSLLTDQESYDTTLNVKGKEYRAHRLILMARSSVFASMFKHDTSEKQSGVINIPDCDPGSFHDFLQYVYCGKIENISSHNAVHLYQTSDKYDIQELKSICVNYLIQHLAIETICEVAVLADMYEEKELLSGVHHFFNENAAQIFATSDWINLMKNHYHLANKLLMEMSKVKIAK